MRKTLARHELKQARTVIEVQKKSPDCWSRDPRGARATRLIILEELTKAMDMAAACRYMEISRSNGHRWLHPGPRKPRKRQMGRLAIGDASRAQILALLCSDLRPSCRLQSAKALSTLLLPRPRCGHLQAVVVGRTRDTYDLAGGGHTKILCQQRHCRDLHGLSLSWIPTPKVLEIFV